MNPIPTWYGEPGGKSIRKHNGAEESVDPILQLRPVTGFDGVGGTEIRDRHPFTGKKSEIDTHTLGREIDNLSQEERQTIIHRKRDRHPFTADKVIRDQQLKSWMSNLVVVSWDIHTCAHRSVTFMDYRHRPMRSIECALLMIFKPKTFSALLKTI